MEAQSGRVLRERNQAVNYFPKQQLYTVVTGHAENRGALRRRSRSEEPHEQNRVAGRRAFRSQSVDQPHIPARRARRSISVDGRLAEGAVSDTNAFNCLAQSNQMLTSELIKMKNEMNAKDKKLDLMSKQNMANQKMIESIVTDCDAQNREIERLEQELREALNRLSESNFIPYT